MIELIKIQDNNGKQAVSARELHRVLEIETKFYDWCKRMADYGFEENIDYSKLSIENEQVDWVLTLETAKHWSMMQRTEKGMIVRNYFIECERKANNYGLAPTRKQLAQWVIELEEKTERLQNVITEQAPKVEVYNQISDSTNLKTVSEVSKILNSGGIRFFRWMREQGILMHNNIPYQRFIEQGYFKVKTKPIQGLSQDYSQTFFTSKGELWITRIWNNTHSQSLVKS